MNKIEILNIKEEVQKIIKEETEKYVKERILMPMNKKDYKGYELIKAISDKEIKDKTKIEVHSLQDNIIAVIEYKNKRLEWGTGEFDTSYLFDDYIYFKILEDNTEEIEELNNKLSIDWTDVGRAMGEICRDIGIGFKKAFENIKDKQ